MTAYDNKIPSLWLFLGWSRDVASKAVIGQENFWSLFLEVSDIEASVNLLGTIKSFYSHLFKLQTTYAFL